jgi:Mg/Co/Ni transporter MgtE
MSDFSNFIHGQITKKKLEKGLEMLRNESAAELKRKIRDFNIDEILQKMDEYDKRRLQELGINVSEFRGRISEKDIQKIHQVLGSDSERVIRKLRNLLY